MNILIIRFSALGDLVTLEPTFRAFRHFFPQAHLTFLTSSIGQGLYEDTAYFNQYIVHKSFSKTLHQARKRKYDLVFNLQCNKPSHYLTFLLKKQRMINKSFNLLQKLFGIKTHSKNAYEMLSLAGCDAKVLKAYFDNPKNTLIQFPSSLVQKEMKHIVLSTGSSPRWESKQWGLARYEMLIEHLLSHGFKITLIGSKLEEKDALYLSQKFPSLQNSVGKTTLSELKILLARACLYVGNDSGPTHIAASVGTDTLTLFGPTDVKHSPKFGHYNGKHLFIKPSSSITCHPCYKGRCPTKHECMESISVNNVLNLILDYQRGKHGLT